MWIFRLFAKAQNDKFFVILPCHTERSEVSINLKYALNSYGFFANAQNDNGDFSPFCKRLKMTKSAVIASEQSERGNP